MSTLRAEIPRAYLPLLAPSRYKGAHGGRGSGKSHHFAEQVILRCYERAMRVACIREVQNTIRDSVRQLLVDKIQKFNLGNFFQVLESEIRGANGSLIIFRGMQSFNAESIKSLEGFDIAYIEEAQSLSAVSWRLLRPTIRKDASEIWCAWNPRHDTDAIDAFFRGPSKHPEAICVEVNWDCNPWFPEVLRKEKDADYAADEEMAQHVWGGDYEIVSEGAYYARLIAQASREGRIGSIPARMGVPVKTSWDIGVDDYTAIWFWQDDGLRVTAVDYYETNGDGADDIMATALPEIFKPAKGDAKFAGWDREQALETLGRVEPFTYACHYLPHDVKMREWGGGARSRVENLVTYGMSNIVKGVPAKPEERVAAMRRILPVMYFDGSNYRVQAGLKRLRRYRRKWNDSLQTYMQPERDDNTHSADAAGEYAINSQVTPPPKKPEPRPKVSVKLPTLDEIVKEHDKGQRHIGNRI